MLPELTAKPILVGIRRSLGPHFAATSIPGRRILLDRAVFEMPGDFERILVHEIFHFAWVRLGHPKRRSWEQLMARELARGARGELGWSAEWRKAKLTSASMQSGARLWRHYLCESFCDTAAWLYGGLRSHGEFTLAQSWRWRRRVWFRREVSSAPVPI